VTLVYDVPAYVCMESRLFVCLFVCLFVRSFVCIEDCKYGEISNFYTLLETFSVNVNVEIVSAPHKDMRGYYTS
jgi:hypothetical protein